MYQIFEKRISQFFQSAPTALFSQNKIGLEKESLRVAPSGGISQLTHPPALGSALTHPHITTDYSEALLEFVTPPYTDKQKLMQFLEDCQSYVYSILKDEILWASSMPCVLAGETSIPIAEYGSSNLGKMKTVYRRGLGHRYGRVMQVIAGVHYNYSFSSSFWHYYQDLEKNNKSQNAFVSQTYFELIRNFQRYGWLIPYLFGASPAVCKSFLHNVETDMENFDETTFYYPYATSLRMGDIGYQNSKEDESGIKVNYDSVTQYVESLRHAITTPHEPFSEMGVKINGEYEQLNANLLQIENEYYSSVRPKQLLENMEMPINALLSRGVRYIELRSLDVNIFEPCGISDKAVYFLEAFIVFCLMKDSPPISTEEHKQISKNIQDVAHMGRRPGLKLQRNGESISLKNWAKEIFDQLQGVCELLDQDVAQPSYSEILEHYHERILDSDATPSAQILRQMRENHEGFFHFSLRKSEEHLDYFKSLQLTEEKIQFFRKLSSDSLEQQRQIESNDTQSFDEFLRDYFSHAMPK